MKQLSDKLTAAEVLHHLWLEQPENVATALATVPVLKSQTPPLLKKLKLFQGFVAPKAPESTDKREEADASGIVGQLA